jgi:hypothetical protein
MIHLIYLYIKEKSSQILFGKNFLTKAGQHHLLFNWENTIKSA